MGRQKGDREDRKVAKKAGGRKGKQKGGREGKRGNWSEFW